MSELYTTILDGTREADDDEIFSPGILRHYYDRYMQISVLPSATSEIALAQARFLAARDEFVAVLQEARERAEYYQRLLGAVRAAEAVVEHGEWQHPVILEAIELMRTETEYLRQRHYRDRSSERVNP